MQSFRTYLTEKTNSPGLTVFDIDDTLFKTKAQVKVIDKDGKVVKVLQSKEYNTHKLKPGEKFDYGEFKDAKNFAKTSVPMKKMIDKAKQIIQRASAKGSKVIIITARADFDNKKVFLDTFRKAGIDIDKVYVERAGNLNLGSSAKNKKFIFHKYLSGDKYARVRFFDDDVSNLRMFNALKKKYPNVDFNAYRVSDDGSVKKYKK